MYLVGGFNPSEKYSQLGWLFTIYGNNMIHVPNQRSVYHMCIYIYTIHIYI